MGNQITYKNRSVDICWFAIILPDRSVSDIIRESVSTSILIQVNELEKHQVMKHGSPEEKQAYQEKQVEKTQVNKQARLSKQPEQPKRARKL